MPDRQDAEPSVSGTHVNEGGDNIDLMEVIRMSEHHSFGFACGSRGVNEGHDIIGFTLVNFGVDKCYIGAFAALEYRCVSMNLELPGIGISRIKIRIDDDGFFQIG